MKKEKTYNYLRVTIKEIPTKLELPPEIGMEMSLKENFITRLHLFAAERLMAKGAIKEPGTYDIRVTWSLFKPNLVKYLYVKVK